MSRSNKFLTPLKAQWFLNGIAIGIWIFQFHFIGFPGRALMFNNIDAPQYSAVGQWLFGGPFTPFITLHTFLFPLWFTCIDTVFGLKGFFVIQSLLWLASVNLLFRGLIRMRLPAIISLIACIVFSLNLTIISMTYEVLTESLTVFVCCIYFYSVATAESVEQLNKRKGVLLFLATVLMLLKPMFEPFFFLSLAAFIFFFFKQKDMKQRKKELWWAGISLLMVSGQLFVMMHYAGVFSLSEIGVVTFRRYLLSQTVSSVQQIDLIAARDLVAHWSSRQTIQFVFAHLGALAGNYFQNLHNNISTFPNETSAIGSPAFELTFMIWWNRFHWLAQLALPILLIFSWRKIGRQSLDLWRIIIVALPMYDVILLIGISFGQGDRLVLPAIPFLIGLYAMLIRIQYSSFENHH